MDYGFIRVGACVPAVRVGDVSANVSELARCVRLAEREGVELLVLPELCLTGYTCQDLFFQSRLIEAAAQGLEQLCKDTTDCRLTYVVGLPIAVKEGLLNAAAVVQGGHVEGIVPKTFLPTYKEFYEGRWFVSAAAIDIATTWHGIPVSNRQLFRIGEALVGIELCEDLWAPVPPSSDLCTAGADIICNLSATNELICKHDYLRSLLVAQSARGICGYVYASAGSGESTQDVVYAGNGLIYENGHLLAASPRFAHEPQLIISEIDIERLRNERRVNTTWRAQAAISRAQHSAQGYLCHTPLPCLAKSPTTPAHLHRYVSPHPFIPGAQILQERCYEILSIQAMGLARRTEHTHAATLVVGLSGGLDSTLALLVCARTCDILKRPHTDILAITMPGFGTTGRTLANARSLAEQIGATLSEIPIAQAATQHLQDIGHDLAAHDITYENAQARERTQVLFDIANQRHGLVVGTGDLSELALGWATYNGDHMSSYAVNVSVPKTLVRYLVEFVARQSTGTLKAVLEDICATPVSPELLPPTADGTIAQKTEEKVGPYELHDFFLYYVLRHGFAPHKILFLALQAFSLSGSEAPSEQRSVMETGHYTEQQIKHWLQVFYHRFFSQQFKRSCLPDGPKVGSVCLSPRGDWRMPSDAHPNEWVRDIPGI